MPEIINAGSIQLDRVVPEVVNAGSIQLDEPTQSWTNPEPSHDPVSVRQPTLGEESFPNISIGMRRGAAFAEKVFGNMADVADIGATIISEATGLDKGNAFRVASDYLRKRSADLTPTPEEMADHTSFGAKIAQAFAETPWVISTFLGGSVLTGGGISGMGLVGAMEAEDKGIKEMIKGGVKDALLGAVLAVIQPLTRITRAVTAGSVGAGMTAAQGGDLNDTLVSFLTMGGLALPGGKGTVGIKDIFGKKPIETPAPVAGVPSVEVKPGEAPVKQSAAIADQSPSDKSAIIQDVSKKDMTPTPTFTTEDGKTFQSVVIPGLKEFVEQDLAPATKSFLEGVKETSKAVLNFIAPRIGVNLESLDLIMKMKGERDFAEFKLEQATADIQKMFSKLTTGEQVTFIDNMKRGNPQASPELQQIADYLRQVDTDTWTEANRLNPSLAWLNNHFRVLWKVVPGTGEEKAGVGFRRPIEGSKGFFKQHTLDDMSQGIDLGGVPQSYNPITMFRMAFGDMQKFITARRMWNGLKEIGAVQFIRIGEKRPDGFVKLDDKIAQVYFGGVPMKEAYDKIMFDNLLDFAEKIGVKHNRVANIRGHKWGEAGIGGDIKTRFSGPESVIAHELGHQLDFKYDLVRILGLEKGLTKRTGAAKELRDLADLRYEGQETSEHYKKYVRKAEEKMAVILESYIHAPDKLKEVAPTIYAKFEQFLTDHPELTELKDIKPSLVLGTNAMEKDIGIVKSGEFVVENGAGRLLNRYLSRDMVREAAVGRGLLGLKNVTTAMELSFSAFHFVFETLEAAASGVGLGIHKISFGVSHANVDSVLSGFKDIVTAPVTPFTTARAGGSALKYVKDPQSFLAESRGKDFIARYPDAANLISDLFTGGGKLAMNQDFKINSIRTFREAIAQNNYIGAAIRGIPAFSELMMKPLFETYIPRLKVGMFLKEYSNALVERAGEINRGELTKPEVARRTWDFVEDRLGEMNFDNLFWDRTFKSSMQILVRSVTWKLGNIRGFGKAFVEQAKEFKDAYTEGRLPTLAPEMGWALGVVAIHTTIGSLIQYMATGKGPQELADFIYPKIDEDGNRISIPTYLRDAFHLAHKPVGWATSSTSGFISRFTEVMRNKDFFGVQVYDPEEIYPQNAVDALVHMTPLPFSVASYKKMQEQGQPPEKKMMSFLGFTKAPFYIEQSPAQQKAYELMGEVMPQKPRTKEEFARASLVKQYSSEFQKALKKNDKIKQGDVAKGLGNDVQAGKLYMSDIDKFVRKIGGEPLENTMKRLPLKEGMQVWDLANEKEKRRLAPIIVDKIFNFADKNPEEFQHMGPKIQLIVAEIEKMGKVITAKPIDEK